MKKILLSTVVMAFAIAAQAGDEQGCCASKTKVSADKKPACSATATTKVSAEKCPMTAAKEAKAGCCAAKGQNAQAKKVLSPKASDLAKR